ncbi:DNA utilization protein GntX [Clostridium liquoris]|uniref:DNA utilization protein GntX n=1 Tax=Clostridium liquoris TaxID=1289519 RepID=A0A2T0BA60_9CLOT|nr:ComF family protein [Clostridium liquoris]PRR80778.1 DNA utilization protein GntX [Clostridium liquoris]
MGKGIIKNLTLIKEGICSIIYSKEDECPICKMYSEEGYLCKECISKIRFCKNRYMLNQYNIEFKYYSIAYYTGNIKELILRLKYKSDFHCGEILSSYMTSKIKEENIPCDILTYVPMKRKSLRERGYNQSKCLAKNIGKELNIPIITTLKKTENTKDQIGLNGIERWENIRGAFTAVNHDKFKNKKIILIDDVITTGATAFCCAEELLMAGAKEINILTAAKSNV